MRISSVEPLVVGTPWRNLSVIRVRTDEGLEGVGEVRMVGHTDALLGYLKEGVPRHVLGADPFRTDDLVRRLMRDDYARMGEIAMSGVAALEMACYDIKGKALGVPVYELLGGAVRDRIPAYANGWYTVERTAADFAAAARKVVERGYRAMKFDPFGPGFYELTRAELIRSIELVEAVRDAIGRDVQLFIEMHGRFTPAEAVRICRALERFEPGWVEEPVPPENLKALKKAAEGITIPVATGERIHTRYDFRELFELQAADIVQPDVTHFGGIGETKKLAAWAEAYYVMLAPHNVGGPISTAANLHLVATCANFKIQEHFNDFADAWVKDMAPGLPEVDPSDGCFPLPTGPGLGITLDAEFCEAYPAQDVDFNLFRENWHRRDARVSEKAPARAPARQRIAVPELLERTRVVAIMRGIDGAVAHDVVEALLAGGVRAIEVTTNTVGALDIVSRLRSAFGERALLGVGTVLDAAAARAALDAGAQFLVCPHSDAQIINEAARRGAACLAGALTPAEVLTAWRAGATAIKLFPGSMGPDYLRALRGPLDQVPLLPTGGVTLDNAAAWIAAGAFGLGLGSALVDEPLVEQRRFDAIAERARTFVDIASRARR